MAVVPASSASSAPSMLPHRTISRSRARSSRHHTSSRISGNVRGADDAEPAQGHQRRPAIVVAREVLGERVTETHVHRALDLTHALHRVDGPPHVVRGYDPLDLTGLAIDDDELRRVAERRVD